MLQGNPGLDTEDVGSRTQTTQEHLKRRDRWLQGLQGTVDLDPLDKHLLRKRRVNAPDTRGEPASILFLTQGS